MTKDEALKLALEALEVSVPVILKDFSRHGKAITAIKEALSSCQCPECKVLLHASDCAVHNEPAYPKGECNCGAQRKPLTDEEIRQICVDNWGGYEQARAIEAKLKEKNT